MLHKKTTPTMAELDRLYRLHGPNSAHICLNALGVILKRVTGTTDWRALPQSVLNGATARKWFETANTAAKNAPTQARAQQIQRTARSTFGQARAVLTPAMLELYAERGHHLPDADAFTNAAKKYSPRLAANGAANLPEDTAIARMRAEWQAWAADAGKKNEFAAVGLMLACGLRKSEVSQARWAWLTERHGAPVLSSHADVKNQSGHLEVVPLNPFWETFLSGVTAWPQRRAADHILTGSATEREDDVFRRIGQWLRACGWTTQKTNHALRDYSASLITMKYGLDMAKHWCRHSSIKTTERSYNRFVDPVAMVQRAHKLDWLSFAGEKK